jgi:hypothetical protein
MANDFRIRNIVIEADTTSYTLNAANSGLNPSLDYDNIQVSVSPSVEGLEYQVELRPVGANHFIQPDLGGWEINAQTEEYVKLVAGQDLFIAGPNLGQNGIIFDAIRVTFSGNTEDCELYCCFIKKD